MRRFLLVTCFVFCGVACETTEEASVEDKGQNQDMGGEDIAVDIGVDSSDLEIDEQDSGPIYADCKEVLELTLMKMELFNTEHV